MWTLAEGLEVVRGLQPESREFGYHVTLGGGVLNAGHSNKDLDIWYLPLNNDSNITRPTALLQYLGNKFLALRPISEYGGATHMGHPIWGMYRMEMLKDPAKRVEIFIIDQAGRV